jgi:uncharacterized DUF497 family protein
MDLRFHFDAVKSRQLQERHGLSLAEFGDVFAGPYILDKRQDEPEQWRAIGWAKGRLHAVIFEERSDPDGPFYHLVTGWPATKEEFHAYQKAYP